MKRITNIEEIKRIQMDILSYVDQYCRKNGIRYSISGGTLLGAVRHGGYIPWDDDIDILLPRNDYEKLIHAFNRNKSNFALYSFDQTKGYPQPYAKIGDERTIVIEPGINGVCGINIDVFPVDHVPDDINEQKLFLHTIDLMRNLLVVKGLKWEWRRKLSKNLFMFSCKAASFFISRIRLCHMLNKKTSLYVNDSCKQSGCLVWGYGRKEIMDTTIFENYIDMKFENRTYMALREYDTYLSHLYGDYMKLPPVEKRVTHHDFNAYWK